MLVCSNLKSGFHYGYTSRERNKISDRYRRIVHSLLRARSRPIGLEKNSKTQPTPKWTTAVGAADQTAALVNAGSRTRSVAEIIAVAAGAECRAGAPRAIMDATRMAPKIPCTITQRAIIRTPIVAMARGRISRGDYGDAS